MNARSRILYILVFSLLSVCSVYAETVSWDEALLDYKNKKWDDAATKFETLAQGTVDHPGLQYNLGCAYFRLDKFEAARAAFEKGRTLAISKGLKKKLLFNLGCTNFAESQVLLKTKPIKSLERLKSAIVNFRQVLRLDSKDSGAVHNLELSLKTYREQWKTSQKAREEKKAEQERKKNAENLEKLKKEQEQLSQENEQQNQDSKKQAEAKSKQEKLSEKTKNQLNELQKQADPKNEGAKESLKRAQEAQKQAEQALKAGDSKKAAEKQKEAAEALGEAAKQLKDGSKKEKAEAGKEEDSMAKEAKSALQEEKANKKRRAQLLRQLQRRGIKPVEKDW